MALGAAASHWRLVGDSNGRAVTQVILGDLHLRLGNLEAAGADLTDALGAARSVGAQRMEAYATTSLGQWHRANGRLLDAIAAFDDGIVLAAEVGDRELLAQTLTLRAEAALLQEDLGRARQLLSRAQAEGQLAGSNGILAGIDRALGRLHMLDGAGARAVNHLESALERGGDSLGPDERAETLYWLGTAYLNLGRAQLATSYLDKAIAVAEQANLPGLLAGPAAEEPRLLRHGRELGLNPTLLAEVARLSSTRRPWTGVSLAPVTVVSENDLPKLDVQLFGGFVLHRDGKLISKASGKVDRARELAALLILNPKGLPDENIAELMFGEMPRESALHNLQMAAYSLRKQLGNKAAVRYGARTYQLNPQLELEADVRAFDGALARARGAIGSTLIQALSKAVDAYSGPLLADAAWHWLEPVRLDYQMRFVSATLQLADLVASTDTARSDGLAEQVLAVAPETDIAYERLIQNARQQRDGNAVRRLIKRCVQAAEQFGFAVNPYLLDDQSGSQGGRSTR